MNTLLAGAFQKLFGEVVYVSKTGERYPTYEAWQRGEQAKRLTEIGKKANILNAPRPVHYLKGVSDWNALEHADHVINTLRDSRHKHRWTQDDIDRCVNYLKGLLYWPLGADTKAYINRIIAEILTGIIPAYSSDLDKARAEYEKRESTRREQLGKTDEPIVIESITPTHYEQLKMGPYGVVPAAWWRIRNANPGV